MLYGRKQPIHTTDHTRRAKDDILVYTETELRRAVGNLERGKRVVVASEIFVTETIEIKIKESTQYTKRSTQEAIICGFGSGKLTRKQGIKEPFDLFRITGRYTDDAQSAGLHIQELTFSGFIHAVVLGRPPQPPFYVTDLQYFKGLRITYCTLEDCYALVGAYRASQTYVLRPAIYGFEASNNLLYSTQTGVDRDCVIVNRAPFSLGYYDTLLFERSYIGNNRCLDLNGEPFTYTEENTIFAYMSDSEIVDNNVTGTIEVFAGENVHVKGNTCHRLKVVSSATLLTQPNWSSIIDNYMEDTLVINLNKSSVIGNRVGGTVTHQANTENNRIIGNQINTFAPLAPDVFPNAACHIVRNNFGAGGREIDGYGRVSIPGEILGQTVFDTTTSVPPAVPFVKVVTSSTYEILDNDANTANVAEVSFHVPCNRRVLIRLHCHLRDIQTATPPNFDQLFFEIRQSTGPIPAVNCNVEQAFYYGKNTGAAQVTNGFMPVTFEWIINGNANAFWSAGQAVTIEVWTKVASAGMKVEVWGGQGAAPPFPVSDGSTQYAGPLKVEVEAVSDDLDYTVPTEAPPLKGGKKPPPVPGLPGVPVKKKL